MLRAINSVEEEYKELKRSSNKDLLTSLINVGATAVLGASEIINLATVNNKTLAIGLAMGAVATGTYAAYRGINGLMVNQEAAALKTVLVQHDLQQAPEQAASEPLQK